MNPFHGDTATSENSSCTSGFYTSESDRFYLRRIIAQRSRINKLSRENYVPSRETKLIDKLVKTRAVYDDVRNQLLSGSSISVNEKAVLKPTKFTPAMGKELEEAEKSSDIFSMIDLVDKGIVLGPRKLSKCCSCCSYNARFRSYQHAKKSRRQKGSYTGGCTTSNSSGISNDGSKKNSGFETKNIKSEPCTCAAELEELKKRRSKTLLIKNRPKQTTLIIESSFLGCFPIDEHKVQSNKKSHHTPKRNEVHTTRNREGKLMETLTKLQESSSSRQRWVNKLKNVENKKAMKHLDNDIQTRFNKPLHTTLAHLLLQNIPPEKVLHVKDHSVTKFQNISPMKPNHKNRQDKTEQYRGQYLTGECLKVGIDKGKIKHSYDTKYFQGISNAYNVSIEARQKNDVLLAHNLKYRIVTRRRKNPTNREIPQPSPRSKTNLWLSNSLTKNTHSSRKSHQCNIQNSSHPIHNSGLLTLQLKPKKCISKKDIVTRETTLSKHSSSVRTSSEPNILAMKNIEQYPTTNNQTSTNDDDDFDIKIRSVSTSQVETITKCDSEVISNLSSSLDIQPSTMTKISIDNNYHESASKSVKSRMKRVRYTDEKIIRYKLSQISSSIVKSRQTVIKHKLRRCLCKLKLIKPKHKKTTIPTGAQSIPQSGSRYLHRSDTQKERSHIPLKHNRNQLLHETEHYGICDNKCMKISESALKSKPVLPPKKIKLLSAFKAHKSQVYLRTSGLKTPMEIKSCDNYYFSSTELDTKHSQNFDKKLLKENRSRNQDEKNISLTNMLQENTEKKYKFAMIKKENEEKCLQFGPAMKRCLCTLKLHKKGRNAINHRTACACAKTNMNKEKIYPDVEKVKSRIKGHSSKTPKGKEQGTLSTVVDIFKENDRHKSIKTRVQEKIITTENKQISRKSQVKIKTIDKTFDDDTPKLKRCFCTLQYSKNNKQKKLNMCTCVKARSYLNYNVITPETTLPNNNPLFSNLNHVKKSKNLANQWSHSKGNSSSSMFSVSTLEFESKTMQSYFRKSEFKLLRLDSDSANLSSQNILRFKSKLSIELNGLKNVCVMRENDVDSYYNSLSRRKNREYSDYSKCTPPDLTGIRPLLRRCYCAMNIQVANRGPTHQNKLKPYECEPGICVPYECDPIDCQKIIMGRLTQKTSTMSEARTNLKSSSSSTPVAVPKAKKKQPRAVQATKKKPKDLPQMPPPPPPREKVQSSGKQVVRVGSSFNFDIEFSKNSNNRKRKKEESGPPMIKMKEKASSISPMVKRCFCTLKLQKKGKQQQKSPELKKNQGTSSPPKTKIVPVAKEASQNTKPLKPPKMPKLLSYECEPGVCMPGQCDPHACLELINKRLKKNKGTKSIKSNITSSSSMTPKPKMKTKEKPIQSPKKVHARPVTHVAKPKSVKKPMKPSHQVVRIGSNFSFNIDFFKENCPGSPTKLEPETPKKVSFEYPATENKKIDSGKAVRDMDSQSLSKSMRDMDSQSLSKSMRSTMTGVTPFLKRCFCTLKLQKPDNVKAHVKPENVKTPAKPNNVKTPVKPDNIKAPKEHKDTATKTQKNREKPAKDAMDKSTRTKQAPIQGRKLEPYECEPGVCIPGKCDPYECEKRIKSREMRSKHTSTKTSKGNSVSSLVSESPKPRTKKTQATKPETNQPKDRKTSKRKSRSAVRPKKQRHRSYSCSRPRQALRIGSNFSFNIEFYKDNSPRSPCGSVCMPECEPVCKPVCVSECTKRKKNKTTDTKPSDAKSVATYSGSDLQHKEAQSELKTESKESGGMPALKRCFCTLKLQKMGSQQQKAKKKIDITPKDISTSTPIKKKPEIVVAAKEVGTKTKKEKVTHVTHSKVKLEPHECEPGVCIPGQCDPHECLKRIQQRQTRNLGTETKDPPKKTISSVTLPVEEKKSKKIQPKKEKVVKDKKVKELKDKEIKVKEKKVKKPALCECPPPPPPCPPCPQVVRIGSNFSFNIEFYKDRNCSPIYCPPCNKSLTSISTNCNELKCIDAGCCSPPKKHHHAKSQAVSVKTDSKASAMAPLLKRCFCTLSLQKSSPHITKEKKTKVKKEIPKVATDNKSTSTKKKYVPSVKQMDLGPHECEPGVCVPGMCDPYECLERIKKRGITRKSQTTEPVAISKKVQSKAKEPVNEPPPPRKQDTKKVQNKAKEPLTKPSPPRKQETKKEAKVLKPDQKSMIVEQPRYPLLCDRNNRQVVRISSNFSFNIDFFKNTDIKQMKCKEKCDKPCAVQTGPIKMKCEKKCGKCDDSVSLHSQSDSPKTENKSSGVGKVLKRCFCTAKLTKQGPKTVTVGRVENIGPSFPFARQDYWVQYQTHQIIDKQRNENFEKNICEHCKGSSNPKIMKSKNDAEEMKTILPYSPGKFNKKISRSVIPNCYTQISGLGHDSSQVNQNKDVLKEPYLKGAKRLTIKKSENDIIDDRIQKKSPIKQFVYRCLQIFSKLKNNPSSDQCCAKHNSTGNPIASLKSGGLHPSKSERHSMVKCTSTCPKKSKSLKVTTVIDKKNEDKKRKFSRFQSGEGQIQKAKQIDCPRCQARHSESNKSPDKLVHFSLSSDNKNGSISKQDPKENKKKYSVNNPPCIAMCPSCGGFKITQVDPKSNSTTVPQFPNLQDQSSKNLNKKKSCACVGKCTCCRCVGRCLCTELNEKSGIDKNIYSGEKCVCGSTECSEEIEKLKRELTRQRNAKPSKPCVCGSKICEKEKGKRARSSKRNICECELSMASLKKEKLANKQKKLREKAKLLSHKKQKQAAEKNEKDAAKKKHQAFVERQARYAKEDTIRKRQRKQKDKQMLQNVKKYKNSGDVMLITESALDIAKLGFVSAGNIVRSVGKAAIDPKFTLQNIKASVTDPSRAWAKIKSAAEDSPGISTLKRVQLRLSETNFVKKGKETLEQNPITNYMLHMNDKNPKNRLKKKPKAKNKRVNIDFQCSPYMLSLRKKPHLAVYLCCPWFYPHCISLLNIWKQFTDVMLFLLAVAVWSPCIFCMEACRALMCCFLCTG